MTSKLLLTAAILLAALSVARADWHSELRLLSPSNELKGTARFKKPKIRLDLEQGSTPSSVIIDYSNGKSWTLLHKSKTSLAGDQSRVHVKLPLCAKKNLETCLADAGFHKTGAEAVNGHPCAVYEKLEKARALRLRLWRPTDIAEMAVARSASYDEEGTVLSQVDFIGIKVEAQDDAVFQVPLNYLLVAPKAP